MEAKKCFIKIDSVFLLDCKVGGIASENEPKYNLALTSFEKDISKEEKTLYITAKFNLFHGIKKPPFKLEATFGVKYTRPEDKGMTFEEFKDQVALAHFIPYLREFISNMTTRMPIKPLFLPPINTFALYEAYQKRLSESKQ